MCLSLQVLSFEGKRLTFFVNMYCAHLFSALLLVDIVPELSSTVRCFLSRYHGYHILVRFFYRNCRSFFFEKAVHLYRDVVSCINLIELVFLHFPKLDTCGETRQFSEAKSLSRSISALSGLSRDLSNLYWALVKNDLPEVNSHWCSCDCWRPKGAWQYIW